VCLSVFVILLTYRSLVFVTGKTNDGLKLYGRIMRHADPALCGVGAFGYYLYYRFSNSDEMNPPPDFTNNKAWFDMKLLTDGTKHGNTKVMSNESFSKGVKSVLDKLGIASKHYLHLGRVLGPVTLEKLEMESRDIQNLGNWDPSTQAQRYSTKLPMRPIRAIAGFQDAGGMHYNPRTVVEPPECLTRMIFPFADRCLQDVEDQSKQDHVDRYTAVHFLKLLIDLRRIILQDAAATLVTHGERREHPIFQLPVFQQEAFEVRFRVFDC
jgi:hypothetical protein